MESFRERTCTGAELCEDAEFLCEHRLKELNEGLHSCYRNSIFVIDRLLTNYKLVFPFFTNHTFEHSAQVINFCNALLGRENVNQLNADELYILLMGASLHDIGMGISESDCHAFSKNVPGAEKYIKEHPEARLGDVTRTFHHEFSAEFIRKYKDLFEIPSAEHTYCIAQVARGHRKLDLLDEREFDPHYTLADGTVVRLPYLAALVRLADELDIAADRNLLFNSAEAEGECSDYQMLCFHCHEAVPRIGFDGGCITVYYRTDDPAVYEELMNLNKKVQKTFGEFVAVVRGRTDLELRQSEARFERIQ